MILCIETTSHNCSVALSNSGILLDCIEERGDGYSHAEKLHVNILELVRRNGLQLTELKSVAVSAGPGSYTGLRIGVAAAKGLCFSLSIPLISLNTLDFLFESVSKSHSGDIYIPVIDARRMEVYTCTYDKDGKVIEGTKAVVVDKDFFHYQKERVLIFGEGVEKLTSLLPSNYSIIKDVFPSATMMVTASFIKHESSQFEDLAYYEPFYLKDFIAGVSTKTLL